MEYKKIIDISVPLNAQTAIYPGNPPVLIKTIKSSTGTSVHSEISLGSHTGTHVDAPFHAVENGLTLDKVPLEQFIGTCKVFDFSHKKDCVSLEDIKSKTVVKGDRVLLKTNNSLRGLETFYDDYAYLSGEAADYLAGLEVSLVGIDAMSIKQRGSKDLRPHTVILSKNIPILEGLNLRDVAEGEFFLIALAPKFDIDGSPIRAVLLQ